MEITYIKTTQSNLNNVPIVDGQNIFISDNDSYYIDFNSKRNQIARQDEVTANAEAIEATQDMISDAYDPTATYAVGDYCIYNNILYRCNTAIATGEAFTPAKWDATTVAKELPLITTHTLNTTTINGNSFATIDIPYSTALNKRPFSVVLSSNLNKSIALIASCHELGGWGGFRIILYNPYGAAETYAGELKILWCDYTP